MQLLKQTRELHQRVSGLAAARGRYEESKELDDFRAEKLVPRLERIAKVRATYNALAQSTVLQSSTLVPATLPSKVARLKERFVRSPTRTTLVANNGWPALQPMVDAGLVSAESALREAWGAYCISKVPKDTPTELRQDPNIDTHPENGPLLQAYETLYQQLAKISSVLPRGSEQVDDFLRLADRAKSTLEQFNREPPSPRQAPPPHVHRFLQELQRRGAASLEMLSPEVLEWLWSTGRQDQFEIRRKAV